MCFRSMDTQHVKLNFLAFPEKLCRAAPNMPWTTHERKRKSHFSQRTHFRTCSFYLFYVCLVPFSNRGGFYLKQPKKQSEKNSWGFPTNLVLTMAEHLAVSQHNRCTGQCKLSAKKKQGILIFMILHENPDKRKQLFL